MNKKTAQPIILASSSPRRKELLTGLGLEFSVIPSDVSEEMEKSSSPEEMVKELAYRKAEAVARQVDQGLIIGSDTIVVLDGEVLGKPRDKTEAFSMLTRLQGREHEVFSGLSIVDAKTHECETGFQSTKVQMRSLSDREIRLYIATNEPMDKAGSYAIQGIGATLVERINGDYFTVVGLPLALTAKYLRIFGVDILHE
jgi:septum formation protein